jgi:DNA-binding NarL/FixJ family response regulator
LTPIHVVVVDDHMVFREGLRALLGRVDDIGIVGEAATTQEAIEVTEAVRQRWRPRLPAQGRRAGRHHPGHCRRERRAGNLRSGHCIPCDSRHPAPTSDRPFPVLTDREHEILDRLARGIRNEAIAARMGISIKTVQNNVSTILLKLGATDRGAQAVALAANAGWAATNEV